MSESLIIANLVISSISIFLIPIVSSLVSCIGRIRHSKCCGSETELEPLSKKQDSFKEVKIDK
jgi:hypothetical protein